MKILSFLIALPLMLSTFSNPLNKDFYPQLTQNGIIDHSEMKMLGEYMLKELVLKSAKSDAFIDFSDETEPLSGEFFIKSKKDNKKVGFNFKEIVDGNSADCFFIYGKQEKLCISSKVTNNKLVFTSRVISIIDLKKYMPTGIDPKSVHRISGALVQTCNQLTRRFNHVETPFFSSKSNPSTVLISMSPMDRPTFQTIEHCSYDSEKQIAIQRTALTTDQEIYEANQITNVEERQKLLNKIFGED